MRIKLSILACLILLVGCSPGNCRKAELSGRGFHQCLFNPQLDIYAYLKHYRNIDTQTLTFPPQLHRYHRDGFPFLIAFKDGKKVFSGGIGDYENRSLSLKKELWPDAPPFTALTGPLMIAMNFINENQAHLSIAVVPDGQESILKKLQERASLSDPKFAVPAKYQSDLMEEERALNLHFIGLAKDFDLSAFNAAQSPIHFEGDVIAMGPYRFPRFGKISNILLIIGLFRQ